MKPACKKHRLCWALVRTFITEMRKPPSERLRAAGVIVWPIEGWMCDKVFGPHP